MEKQVSLQEAAAVLREQFGERLAAGQGEGRDMMKDVLKHKFNISDHDASELVRSLEAAHSIRWFEPRGGPSAIAPAAPIGPSGGGVVVGDAPGNILPVGAEGAEGYWQL